MSSISLGSLSLPSNSSIMSDSEMKIELERIYQELIDRNERYEEINISEVLNLQEQLNRASPVLHADPKYQEIVEGTEVLAVSIFETDKYSQTSSACFEYEGKKYLVKPTKGEGACAIHALLGKEINGVFRFPGHEASSSSAAKKYFKNSLKTALKTKQHIKQIFCDVILGYLTALDHSALMLFGVQSDLGTKIKQHWNNLESFYKYLIQKNNTEEADLWVRAAEEKSSFILNNILSQATPGSPYHGKDPQEILSIFQEDPAQILSLINEQPDLFIDLLKKPLRKQILNLRDKKNQFLDQLSTDKQRLILSSKVVKHYNKTVCNPLFYLNTNEIKLAAHIFKKNVLIIASQANGIEPVEQISTSPSSEELIVIHHYWSHFSRCVKIDPPPPFASSRTNPFFALHRETRPNYFRTGLMTVKSFNPDTNELETEFTSAEQKALFDRAIANSMAAFGHYTLAKNRTREEASNSSSLLWTHKALKQTANQIRVENGKESKAENYDKHADSLAQKFAQAKQDYRNILAEMKEIFLPSNLDINRFDKFMNLREKAISINPSGFMPHKFSLILAAFLIENFPEMTEFLINEAYKCSPLLTFNFLARILIAKREVTQDQKFFQAFSGLFFKRFPYDAVGYLIVNSIKNSEEIRKKIDRSRQAFSQLLSEALEAVQKGQWEEARNKFSDAEFYHISDKRPYMYKVLIDLLKQGRAVSVEKIMAAMQSIIDWFNPESSLPALFDDSPNSLKTNEQLETPILKQILKIHSFPKNTKFVARLIALMETYLSDPHADLIWAKMVIDLTKDFTNASNGWKRLLEMHISSTYSRLKDLKQDLTEYEECIFTKDDKLFINLSITLTWPPESKPAKIFINPQSFEIPLNTVARLFKDILWKSYNDYCLFVIREGANIDSIYTSQISEIKTLYCPFVNALLERINDDTNSEERGAFLQWAIHHIKIWPARYLQALTDFVIRWQLQRPVSHENMHRKLISLENIWLEESSKILSSHSNSLNTAKKAWELLRHKQYSKAKSLINPFFANWQNNLSDGVDPIALTVLCAVRMLSNNPKLFEAMPSVAKSVYHSRMIWLALSILAREGAENMHVIPNNEISQKDIKLLCHFYTGRRRSETDAQYSKRLDAMQVPNTSDLRELKRLSKQEETWAIPLARVKLTEQISEIIKNKKYLHDQYCAHNRRIKQEEPDYTTDRKFIRWVKEYRNLISDYLNDKEKVKTQFNKTFPRLHPTVKDRFFQELETKADHQIKFQELNEKTQKSLVIFEKRFWQLVEQTAELIARVHSGRRNEVDYDIIVDTQKEARFVAQLIYEWSWNAYSGEIDSTFVDAFHGPEIHIWTGAPRIPHYNAGLYSNGNLENIHVFYVSKAKI